MSHCTACAPDQWPATAAPMSIAMRWPDARVVSGAAHLREVPVGAEIAGAHFGVGIESAAGEHDGLRRRSYWRPWWRTRTPPRAHRRGAARGRGVVEHRDAGCSSAACSAATGAAAAEDVAGEAAPELEFAIDLEGLAAERGLEPHAMAAQPQRRPRSCCRSAPRSDRDRSDIRSAGPCRRNIGLRCRCRNRWSRGPDRRCRARGAAGRRRRSTRSGRRRR